MFRNEKIRDVEREQREICREYALFFKPLDMFEVIVIA